VDKTKAMMTSFLTIALTIIISFHISSPSPALAQPSINEPNLTAELVLDGLSSSTSIAFLDENNILLLEKEGNVRLSQMVNCNHSLYYNHKELKAITNVDS